MKACHRFVLLHYQMGSPNFVYFICVPSLSFLITVPFFPFPLLVSVSAYAYYVTGCTLLHPMHSSFFPVSILYHLNLVTLAAIEAII